LTGWSITNFRQDASDNTNIMVGVGHKRASWWLEFMAQRQYSMRTSQWFVDTRFQASPWKGSRLFLEHSPFLERKALYQFVLFEQRAKAVGLGFESENVYAGGRDSLGIGPRISFKPIPLGKQPLNVSMAYQLRRGEPDVVRFYFALPFKLP
jgi:hypothetical protein